MVREYELICIDNIKPIKSNGDVPEIVMKIENLANWL